MDPYLCTRHGLGVEYGMFDGGPHVVESSLQEVPDCGLPGARRADYDHPHPLTQLRVQLQCLVDLGRRK